MGSGALSRHLSQGHRGDLGSYTCKIFRRCSLPMLYLVENTLRNGNTTQKTSPIRSNIQIYRWGLCTSGESRLAETTMSQRSSGWIENSWCNAIIYHKISIVWISPARGSTVDCQHQSIQHPYPLIRPRGLQGIQPILAHNWARGGVNPGPVTWLLIISTKAVCNIVSMFPRCTMQLLLVCRRCFKWDESYKASYRYGT